MPSRVTLNSPNDREVKAIEGELLKMAVYRILRPSRIGTGKIKDGYWYNLWIERLTDSSSAYFNPLFLSQLREVAPQWLMTGSEQKKTYILKLSERSKKISDLKKVSLYEFCLELATPSSHRFDKDFLHQLQSVSREWYCSLMDIMSKKDSRKSDLRDARTKRSILNILASRKPTPKISRDKYRERFNAYTSESSSEYDAQFVLQVERLEQIRLRKNIPWAQNTDFILNKTINPRPFTRMQADVQMVYIEKHQKYSK